LLGFGVYTIYKSQTRNSLEPIFQQDSQNSFPSATSSATPNIQGVNIPPNQPDTGSSELEIKNAGIKLSTPTSGEQISSPVKVTGTANVTSQTVIIKVFDSNGNILGQGRSSACVGLDACPFEATITFQHPTAGNGSVEIYSPSTIDSSATYLQTIPVIF